MDVITEDKLPELDRRQSEGGSSRDSRAKGSFVSPRDKFKKSHSTTKETAPKSNNSTKEALKSSGLSSSEKRRSKGFKGNPLSDLLRDSSGESRGSSDLKKTKITDKSSSDSLATAPRKPSLSDSKKGLKSKGLSASDSHAVNNKTNSTPSPQTSLSNSQAVPVKQVDPPPLSLPLSSPPPNKDLPPIPSPTGSRKELPQPPKKACSSKTQSTGTPSGALTQSTCATPAGNSTQDQSSGGQPQETITPQKVDYRVEKNDEQIDFIHRSFDEFPQELKDAIAAQGINPQDVTGKKLDYLWHIVWFLNRKNFDQDFVCYHRVHQLPAISDEQKETAAKLIKNIDCPMKKIFPSLDFSAAGGFGQVYVGKMKVEKKKKLRIAIKKLPQTTTKEKNANMTELFFLSTLSHPNIVKFEGAFFWTADPTSKKEDEQTDHMIIAMEWLEGGTLHQAARAGARFADHHLAFITKECFRALEYLHSLNFIHRDLKSANVMLSIQGEVKLIDFGLACDLSLGRRNRMQGSPMWIPPEMIQCRPHGFAADIWSMGVCILEFYLGGPPLKRQPIQCMYTAATQGFAHLIPESASPHARSFIAECLTVEPDKRPSASELLKHKWVAPIQGESKGIKEILRSIFLAKNLSSVGF